ncbi:hypothetical protein GQ53DRAFT_420183 [Thozetella sp. PMI_491]|nr:hypothetical protein GQ53DRAFT_420183 [Thozetella sp. PMI_491]
MSRQHVVGDSPFLKRVLIPFWVVRILIMVIEIGIYGLAIGVISASRNNLTKLYNDYGIKSSVDSIIAILCVVEVIIVLCLVLDIVTIVKRAQRKLSPRLFLIVNVIQTTFWLIMFILSMIGAKTALSVGLNVFCLLSFIGLLIYAAVIFHQDRKGKFRGAYARTDNPIESHGLVHQTALPGSYPPPPPFTHVEPQKPEQYYGSQPYNVQPYNGQAYNNQAYMDPASHPQPHQQQYA